MDATFFETAAAFRAWLEQHHANAKELLVGYYKKHTGMPSMTWPESVDEALCYGWIDGIRRSIDDQRYSIRFTPRKAASIWSAVNVERVAVLTAEGRMQPAGLRAFAAQNAQRTAIYAYEQREAATLGADDEALFRADSAAWAFFESQPAWYRRTAIWWVISAKREETRHKRLATLIADSAAHRTIRELTRSTKAQTPGNVPDE